MASFCYVYAIVGSGFSLPPGLTGLDDAPLGTVCWRSVAAVTSLSALAEMPRSPMHLLQHEDVVEALRRLGPALPVRAGTILAGPDAVRRTLDERHEVLAADLVRVGVGFELHLGVLWADRGPDDPGAGDERPVVGDAAPEATPGTVYLRARLAHHAREHARRAKAQVVAEQLRRTLGPLTIEHRLTASSAPRLAVTGELLVRPSRFEAFLAAFGDARRSRPDLHFLLSGPWPPYSFVTPER